MNKYVIENVFPTPIYSTIIHNLYEVQDEIDNKISGVKFTCPENWGKTHLLSTTTFGDNIIDDLNLVNTKNTIEEHLKVYCNEIEFQFKNYSMNSWFTLFEKNNYAHIHTHSYYDVSGCYYYQTNGDDGDIFFESPNLASSNSYCYTRKYGDRWRHKPKVGKLILFPSWLPHGVLTNETDSKRISLAFNILFNRE